ncbi:hypothetical protein SAMN05192558_101411 [Actinokineospora alba]|uniref:Uncharacterized protein n=1 Tax=Actinokineospora alba TaxID=504798 RepID=A0A1H0FKM0_9PSEU|nr:hypothetical protein [Actinokineospora alba]TDP69518.1 hypothetical protein C8E96_5107 [Actinokineospora alba]SDI15039.1 hypothetical protein SAMN05421871_103459 [Actinokineospora alba]SDN95187.1 hypothetical protein SAMN05192558_101411 [Actinokineospora alba]
MTTTSRTGVRPVLAAVTGLIAVSAFAGAIAISTGIIDFGPVIDMRLPLDSPLLAAIALLAVVALPMGAASWCATTGHPRCRQVAITAGALLIAWIIVQIGFIQTFSWLQPVMAAAGAAVLAAGLLGRKEPR